MVYFLCLGELAQTNPVRGKPLSIFDLIWLFFLLSSLQPVLQKWYLNSQRTRAFRGLE